MPEVFIFEKAKNEAKSFCYRFNVGLYRSFSVLMTLRSGRIIALVAREGFRHGS